MAQQRTLVKIDIAATGTLVAAVAGAVISVIQYTLVAAGAVTIKFTSDTTDLTGAMSLITGVPLTAVAPPMLHGAYSLMQTAKGEGLKVTLGSGVQISGHMVVEISSAAP